MLPALLRRTCFHRDSQVVAARRAQARYGGANPTAYLRPSAQLPGQSRKLCATKLLQTEQLASEIHPLNYRGEALASRRIQRLLTQWAWMAGRRANAERVAELMRNTLPQCQRSITLQAA